MIPAPVAWDTARSFPSGSLGARGETARGTESGEAPA